MPIGFAIVISGLVYFFTRPNEPAYEGKPLSYWERQFPAENSEAALKALGSNSVSFLIKSIHRKESPIGRTYKNTVAKLPPLLAKWVPVSSFDADYFRAHAASTLGNIGSDAIRAVPDLIEALNDPFHGARNNAANALGRIAPQTTYAHRAVAGLIKATGDPHLMVRANAYYSLGKFAPEATEVIPVIQRGLSDPQSIVRTHALQALARCSSAATAAVPEIQRRLEDDDRSVRFAATNALQQVLEVPQSQNK